MKTLEDKDFYEIYRKVLTVSLEETAAKSVFLKSAWEILKDKDETRHWLCFMDPPPVEWVRQHEKNDKELYVRLLSKS